MLLKVLVDVSEITDRKDEIKEDFVDLKCDRSSLQSLEVW